MSPAKSILIALLIFLFLAATAGCGLFRQTEPAPGPGEVEDQDGRVTFTASELFTGREVNFPADFQERVVFIAYFANG